MFGFNPIENTTPEIPTKPALFSDIDIDLFDQQGNIVFGNYNLNPFGGGLSSNIQQKNKSLFGISNDNPDNAKSISTNNNSSNNCQNYFSPARDSTIGFTFNGENIIEKQGVAMFMNINILNKFLHASNEELRLADYEKKQNGNIVKYKIRNTLNKITKSDNSNAKEGLDFTTSNGNNKNATSSSIGNSVFFGNNTNQESSLFGNTNTNTNQGVGLFGINNQQQEGSLFNNNAKSGGWIFGYNSDTTKNILGNNTTGEGLFKNNQNNSSSTSGGLFGNNIGNTNIGTSQSGGLFWNINDKNSQSNSLFNNDNYKKEVGLFGNNNSNLLFNNIEANNFSLFGNNTNNGNSLTGNENTSNSLFGNNAAGNNNSSLFNNNTQNNNTNNGGN